MKRLSFLILTIILYIFVYSDEDFFVGPGDRVTIAFQAFGVNSFAQSRISDNGYLPIIMSSYDEEQTLVKNVKYLTSVKVSNFTFNELEEAVKSAIKEVYSNASVTVLVNSTRYTIHLIANTSEHIVPLKYVEDMTIWDYISNSNIYANQGLVDEVIVITRKGKKIQLSGDKIFTYIPDWGASIFIPKQSVFVEGGVANPGGQAYVEGKRAKYYVGASGGIKSGDISISKGYIIRADNGEKLSIKDNPVVNVNDRIVIPQPRLTLLNYIEIFLNLSLTIIALLL